MIELPIDLPIKSIIKLMKFYEEQNIIVCSKSNKVFLVNSPSFFNEVITTDRKPYEMYFQLHNESLKSV